MAQLAEAVDSKSTGWGFESLAGHMDDEDRERCSRCGDEITDTNRSKLVGDDMCFDCRFEHDNP